MLFGGFNGFQWDSVVFSGFREFFFFLEGGQRVVVKVEVFKRRGVKGRGFQRRGEGRFVKGRRGGKGGGGRGLLRRC